MAIRNKRMCENHMTVELFDFFLYVGGEVDGGGGGGGDGAN